MNSASPRVLRNTLFSITLFALISCGGGKEEAPPTPACPTCPVCEASPTPAVQDIGSLVDKLKETNFKKFRVDPESFAAAVSKFGISEMLGKKEVTAENFPKMVGFFWQVDSEFRIQYLRAMMTSNRLVDMLKPTVGKFDVNVAPKDLEAEDISSLLSQAIVDWAQVQRTLEDDFMGMGVENVMGVKPSDEMPHAEAMMAEMLAIVKPPEPPATPGPQATSASLLSLLVADAQAQAQPVPKGKPGAALTKGSKAVPRVKVATAPLLLARVISFNVGGKNFVLQSPLMAAEPEFRAIPVDQFQFKLEKMSVGPGYRDAVNGMVEELASKPKRDIIDWWRFSHGVTELRLLNQLVDYSKVEASPVQPAPASGGVSTAPAAQPAANPGGITASPLSGGPSETSGSGATQRPATASAAATPSTAEARPSNAPSSTAPGAAAARPEDQPSAAQPQLGAVRPTSGPSGAPSPSTEVPKSVPSTELPKSAPAAEVPKLTP